MQTPENIANPYQPFYNDLFNKINPLGKDVLDSTTIAAFLKTAQGVNVSQLSQIWDLACETSGFTNRGVLNKLGIFICFKFIAAVQQGFPLSPTVLSDPSLEPPRFDTFFQPPLPQQPQSTSFVMTTEKSLSSDWAIGLNDLQKYEAIFDSLGPIDGRLSGNQCRPVLLNSQLPKGILAKIWDLADIDADGFLDRPEFCVALYLVYSALQNDPIPEKLPPTLVPPVKRGIINQTIPREDMPSTHPHALTWSSRASSAASLNIQNQQPSYSPPTVSKNIVPISSSLFDRNLNDWHVENLGQYESEFAELDKDHDGFVTGNDVRDSFLKFGLSQANLARIWAHVDNQKLGRLNLEQYAKCILLIRECQEGIPSRTRVSISSPVPPQGPLARRDSQISTNSGSGVRPLLPENPRVQELTANIEVMQQKKRKAEEELFQAEADLKVKNSEVKNLEIELLTLEATVKQLRVQKVEANKRLNDLDTRIAKLEVIYGESQQRLQEEENRIQKTKTDILQARENSDNEDKILEQLRIEGQNRNQKLLNARLFLKQQHEKFVSFVDELTHLERRMACQETESISLKEQMEQMKKILEGVEKDDNNSKQELLEKTFLQENLSNSQQQTTTLPSTFSGPFIKNSDPFMSNNNVSEEDPFLSKSEDGNLKIDNNTNNFADFAKFSS